MIESEQYVLGALMQNPDTLDRVLPILKRPADFYDKRHRLIYDVIQCLAENQAPFDISAVFAELEVRDEVKVIGSRVFLMDLWDIAGLGAYIIHHAEQVREKARLRRLIDYSKNIVESAYRSEAESDALAEQLDVFLLELAESTQDSGPVNLADVTQNHIDGLLSINPNATHHWIETRVADLNKKITGLFRGDMCIIAAPPSMGKTSFALDLVLYNQTFGKKSLFFSVDQTRNSIMERLITGLTGVTKRKLYSGRMTDVEKEAVCRAAVKVTGYRNLFVSETPGLTALDIRSQARRLKRTEGLDIVVVDYIGLLKSHRRADNRNLEVAEMSRILKEAAKELDVVMVVLSQLNRTYDELRIDPEKNLWGIPRMSQLRDSGALEQDANVLLFPWVPAELMKKRYGEQSDAYINIMRSRPELERLAYIIIGKNKDGETGMIECRRDVERMRFYTESKAERTQPDTEMAF